jgi:hypothetical protein
MNDPVQGWERSNLEGAPTRLYEVWSWQRRRKDGTVLWPEEQYWQFHGYRVLSLRQAQRYLDFDYHVERSRSRDRSGTMPLFPLLGSTGSGQADRLDEVSVPESGPSGS